MLLSSTLESSNCKMFVCSVRRCCVTSDTQCTKMILTSGEAVPNHCVAAGFFLSTTSEWDDDPTCVKEGGRGKYWGSSTKWAVPLPYCQIWLVYSTLHYRFTFPYQLSFSFCALWSLFDFDSTLSRRQWSEMRQILWRWSHCRAVLAFAFLPACGFLCQFLALFGQRGAHLAAAPLAAALRHQHNGAADWLPASVLR